MRTWAAHRRILPTKVGGFWLVYAAVIVAIAAWWLG